MRIKLCLPKGKPNEFFYGCLNGHEYEVTKQDRDYVTIEKLNDGYRTYIPIEWCIVVDNYELLEELFTI
jgi:hypothetical protein